MNLATIVNCWAMKKREILASVRKQKNEVAIFPIENSHHSTKYGWISHILNRLVVWHIGVFSEVVYRGSNWHGKNRYSKKWLKLLLRSHSLCKEESYKRNCIKVLFASELKVKL